MTRRQGLSHPVEPNENAPTTTTNGAVMTQDLLMQPAAACHPPSLACTLDDVTFQLPSSHILGVLGRTGSGKTTLVHPMPCLNERIKSLHQFPTPYTYCPARFIV
jgi:ABC-type protease/lipase transport system fused ATPase/permease subunit